jgi:hypothetical protein
MVVNEITEACSRATRQTHFNLLEDLVDEEERGKVVGECNTGWTWVRVEDMKSFNSLMGDLGKRFRLMTLQSFLNAAELQVSK